MKTKWKTLAISIALPLASGGLSALLTRGSFDRYQQLPLPPLAPPPLVFPIVWTILFLLMGTSCWLAWERSVCPKAHICGSGESSVSAKLRAASFWLLPYALQLTANFIWPLLFFRTGWLGAAFFWLLLLLLLVILTALRLSAVSRTAALLQIPYLLWLLFAGYLNLSVWLAAQ